LVDLAPKSARLWAIRAGFQRRGPLHHRINISIVPVASLSRLRHDFAQCLHQLGLPVGLAQLRRCFEAEGKQTNASTWLCCQGFIPVSSGLEPQITPVGLDHA
jgi:hypothetical protein